MSAPNTRRRGEPRYVETEEYLQMVGRILTALGNRVGNADIEMLRGLAELPGVIDTILADTVHQLHDRDQYSWADIARVLGVSREAAWQRFGRQGRLHTQRPGPQAVANSWKRRDPGNGPDLTGVPLIDVTGLHLQSHAFWTCPVPIGPERISRITDHPELVSELDPGGFWSPDEDEATS
jgi:hypothetical protein